MPETKKKPQKPSDASKQVKEPVVNQPILSEEQTLYEQEKLAEAEKVNFIASLNIEPPPIHIDYINTGGSRDKRYSFDVDARVCVIGTKLGQPSIYRTQDRLEHVGSPIKLNIINLLQKDSSQIDNKDINLIAETIKKSKTNKIIISGGLDHAIRIMKELYEKLKGIDKTIIYGGSNSSFYSNRKAIFVDTGVELAAVQLYPKGSFMIATNLAVFDIKNIERNLFPAIEHKDVMRSIFSKTNSLTDATGKLLNIPKFTAVDFGGTFGKILEYSANNINQDYVYPNIGSLDSLFNDVLVKFGASVGMADKVIIGERIDSMLSDDVYRQRILAILRAIETKHQIITHGTDSMANTMYEVFQRGNMGKNYIFTGSCTPLSEEETTDGFHSVGAAFAIVSYLEAIEKGDIKKRPESNVWLAIGGLVLPYNENIIKDNEGRFIHTTCEQHHKYLELNMKHLTLYQKGYKLKNKKNMW